jgi:hypothetical protein
VERRARGRHSDAHPTKANPTKANPTKANHQSKSVILSLEVIERVGGRDRRQGAITAQSNRNRDGWRPKT